MPCRSIFKIAVIIVAVCGASLSIAAGNQTLTIDDLLALKSVADPQVSPDGKWIAQTVTRIDIEADESTSQIFMASIDSGEVVQLTSADGTEIEGLIFTPPNDRKGTRYLDWYDRTVRGN